VYDNPDDALEAVKNMLVKNAMQPFMYEIIKTVLKKVR